MGRGDGGLDHTGGNTFHLPSLSSYTYCYEDFCALSTCGHCGASVYFIQHNGGRFFVDELGWPWPKHSCEAAAPDPKWLTYMLASPVASQGKNFFVGIITHARWLPAEKSKPCRIALAVDGGQKARKFVAVHGTNTANCYWGCIALVNMGKAMLVTSRYREAPLLDVEVSADELGLPRTWESWDSEPRA